MCGVRCGVRCAVYGVGYSVHVCVRARGVLSLVWSIRRCSAVSFHLFGLSGVAAYTDPQPFVAQTRVMQCNAMRRRSKGTHLLTEPTSAPHVYDVIREAASTISTVWGSSNIFNTVGYVAPELDRGDLLIYDSRTLHRGLGNEGGSARPVLIYRYDAPETHPNDTHGLVSTFVFRHIGNALRFFGHPADQHQHQHQHRAATATEAEVK